MDSGFKFGQMETNTKANSNSLLKMEKVNYTLTKAIHTQANSKIICSMDMEYTDGKMENFMKEISKTVK